MAKSAKDRQRDYRERQAKLVARAAKMQAALEAVVAKLNGTEKPAALAILDIAKEGLAG